METSVADSTWTLRVTDGFAYKLYVYTIIKMSVFDAKTGHIANINRHF